ncbi:hypothetical protein CapIbe_003622 [Capra ibex]
MHSVRMPELGDGKVNGSAWRGPRNGDNPRLRGGTLPAQFLGCAAGSPVLFGPRQRPPARDPFVFAVDIIRLSLKLGIRDV